MNASLETGAHLKSAGFSRRYVWYLNDLMDLVLDPVVLILAAAGALFVTLLFLRLHWGIYVLLLVSMLSILAFDVGPFTVRPDQVVSLVLAAILFVFMIAGKRPVVTTLLDWLIVSYLILNVISSLVNAPDIKTSLQRCLLLAVTFSAYFVSTQLIRTPEVLSKVVMILLIAGVIQAIYGILSVILITKGIHIGGAYISDTDIYATGTFLEGNIFGSFQMMIGLILMSFLFSGNLKVEKGLILLALIVVLIASLMSFTRAAWLGFLMGSLSFVIFNRKRILNRLSRHIPWLATAFLLLLILGYTASSLITQDSRTLMDRYKERADRILEYRSGTGSSRLEAWKHSIHFWKQNPILGNGTDSIKVLAKGSTMPVFGSDYWIPSSLILALHDTGILGLICFCAIQIAFLWKVRWASKTASDPYYQAILEGFFAAFVGVQFAYFFTNAFWLIFIWVFMAIGISCARLAPRLSYDSSFE